MDGPMTYMVGLWGDFKFNDFSGDQVGVHQDKASAAPHWVQVLQNNAGAMKGTIANTDENANTVAIANTKANTIEKQMHVQGGVGIPAIKWCGSEGKLF